MSTGPSRPQQTLPAPDAAYLSGLLDTDKPLLDAMLSAYHDVGWSNPALGAALGMNPPAVSKRITRSRRRPQPPAVAAAVAQRVIPRPVRADGVVNGRRLPPEKIDDLKRLQQAASRVNGATPIDHPDRRAAEQLAAMLHRLMSRHGFTSLYLARSLGVSPRAVTSRLERHGYRDPCPSVAGTPSGAYHNRRIGDADEAEKKIPAEQLEQLRQAWTVWVDEARLDPLREVVDELVLAGHTLAGIAGHLPRAGTGGRATAPLAALAELTAAL